jgi:hypothetical protein
MRTAQNGNNRNAVVVAFPHNRKAESNNTSEQLLRENGVEAVVARRLAKQYSDARLREVLGAASNAKDRPAWIVAALQREYVVVAAKALKAPKAAAAPTRVPAPAPKTLWSPWREVIRTLTQVQPQLCPQLESVHAVLSDSQLQLLVANRIAAAQLSASLPAIQEAVAMVDAQLRVEVDIGSAYAAA